MPGTPFQYLFYIDFEGNIASEQTMAALDELSGATSFLKILGSYPREARGRTAPNVQALVARELEATTARTPAAAVAADPKDHRLVSRGAKKANTVITVKGVRLGGQDFVVIAGPSVVESREQILACARQVRECGGRVLRGGCFRSHASPVGFQGLGLEGLHLLAEAGRAYELPVVTEVLTPSDVKPVAGLADILLIGARNMQNYALLNEVGNVNRPVLLKRGPMSTLEELLDAAEYILSRGNKQVLLCERGIRTFETATRNTLDLASIPVLKRRTHLPVLVDPARAAGQRDLVPPLARAAKALGPHGALLEVHPDPDQALVDGAQALDFAGFARLMQELYAGD
jgi:chorismate mutase/prephenate dehydratase